MNVIEVVCPWCCEPASVALSPDDEGELDQDCQVCCRPWRVWVGPAGGDEGEGEGARSVRVERG